MARMAATGFWSRGCAWMRAMSRVLVPTFRSSCSIAAPTFVNFEKPWALANLLILVPLYRSEVPDRIRRLWCTDFRSAVLARPSRLAAGFLFGALAYLAFSA